MADKEERILITQWNINYDICPAPTEYQCGTSKSCDDCKVGMSRQEAIEKMAKAIFTQIWGLPNNRFDLAKSSVKVRNRKLAEAALNALLEANNA